MARVIEVHEVCGKGKDAQKILFGVYSSMQVLRDSLELSYPEVKNRVIEPFVNYTESDGFCWTCNSIPLISEPEVI